MPASSASRIAAIESRSSWPPQANSQPDPPIAHAPKPIAEMSLPSEQPATKETAINATARRLREEFSDGRIEPPIARPEIRNAALGDRCRAALRGVSLGQTLHQNLDANHAEAGRSPGRRR